VGEWHVLGSHRAYSNALPPLPPPTGHSHPLSSGEQLCQDGLWTFLRIPLAWSHSVEKPAVAPGQVGLTHRRFFSPCVSPGEVAGPGTYWTLNRWMDALLGSFSFALFSFPWRSKLESNGR
jgi:hypothetical protein